ncbi:MAG: CapA family protein [Peptococcia bacterium]|jgi:poly-gamma-glutamate capsule biosynthesis protein CapA/YwtB (metallophosphatase superfamily)
MFKKVAKISMIIVVVFLFLGILAKQFLVESAPITAEEVEAEPVAQEITEIKEVFLTISAIGDCALGTEYAQRGHTFATVFAENKEDCSYFLANVRDVLAQDDLTIANLETCLTTASQRRDKSSAQAAYWIKGEPLYAQILVEGSVEVVNVANNHTYDYREVGYRETLRSLEKVGIAYCGFEHVLIKEMKGIKVGFLGFNQFGNKGVWQAYSALKAQVAESIQALCEQTDLVIVSFHWGNEREIRPSQKQYELAKTAIEAGADLVLGHHPHVLQGIKEYKGKQVVFSLGNFCFGGNRLPYDRDTIIYQQTFVFVEGELVRTTNKIIPCSMTTGAGYNDFQPKVLEGAEAQRVLNKVKERSEMINFKAERNKTRENVPS